MMDNARDLERELDWLASLLEARLKLYFGKDAKARVEDIAPPSLEGSRSAWTELVRACELTAPQRAVLVLALVPHLRPELLDVLWLENEDTQRGFTEFDGVEAQSSGGF